MLMVHLNNCTDISKLSRWREEQLFYDTPHLRLRQLALLVRQLSPRNMVDLGCAQGYLRKLCGEVPYAGCDFVELDCPHDFPFFVVDFNHNSLPSQINGVDLIVCSGLLEYIEDLPQFLVQIKSRLALGGHLIATYINTNHISRKISALSGKLPYQHPDWHVVHSIKDFSKIITRSGLRISDIYAMDCSIRNTVPSEPSGSQQHSLRKARPWSHWLSHHMIYVAQKGT
jgi:SAM-dependent methyltransferase